MYSAAPNPGLKVDGFGEAALRLPISAEDAITLSSIGDVSPFGRREKTIIDPGVRSSRQFDAEKIVFDNPDFSEWLANKVLPEICETMGIDEEGEPRLNLYKMLVYQKGDHFKAHRDSPKEEGMVGTVAVILPCSWTGGVIKLNHADEEKSFDFAGDCKYKVGVAAW